MSRILKAERSLTPSPDLTAEANGRFRFSVNKIANAASIKLNRDFNDPSVYHNLYHAEDMKAGGNDLLQKMHYWSGGSLVSERQVIFYEAVAAIHDIFQKSNLKKRRSNPVTPEEASADWLLFQMAGENNKTQQSKPYSTQDWREGKEAILTTQVIYQGTAIQPSLAEATSPITIALALYDINTAGLADGPRRAIDSTRKLFVEWKVTDLKMRKKLLSGELTPEQEKPFIDGLIEFTNTQIIFTELRRDLLPGEIDSIGYLSGFDKVKAGLKSEFSHFDESIDHLKKARDEMSDYVKEQTESGNAVRFQDVYARLAPPPKV